MFQTLFREAIGDLTQDVRLADALWTDIGERYGHESRRYHNLQHLDQLSQELLRVKPDIMDWAVMMMSVAYHDIVYSTTEQDNEERSAGYARQVLAPVMNGHRLTFCVESILATKRHAASVHPDINYFIDADLAILGAAPRRYQEYAVQIREEYGQYPDLVYNPGRIAVLRQLLDLPDLYKTAVFREMYEAQARKNVQAEITVLVASQAS